MFIHISHFPGQPRQSTTDSPSPTDVMAMNTCRALEMQFTSWFDWENLQIYEMLGRVRLSTLIISVFLKQRGPDWLIWPTSPTY